MNELNQWAFRSARKKIYEDKERTVHQKRQALRQLYQDHVICEDVLFRCYRELLYRYKAEDAVLISMLTGMIVSIFAAAMTSQMAARDVAEHFLQSFLLCIALEVVMAAVIIILFWGLYRHLWMTKSDLLVRPYERKLLEEKLNIYETTAEMRMEVCEKPDTTQSEAEGTEQSCEDGTAHTA